MSDAIAAVDETAVALVATLLSDVRWSRFFSDEELARLVVATVQTAHVPSLDADQP